MTPKVYLASEVLGLSLCTVPFSPDVDNFGMKWIWKQSMEERIYARQSPVGNKESQRLDKESVSCSIERKTKYSEYHNPKLYKSLYTTGRMTLQIGSLEQ